MPACQIVRVDISLPMRNWRNRNCRNESDPNVAIPKSADIFIVSLQQKLDCFFGLSFHLAPSKVKFKCTFFSFPFSTCSGLIRIGRVGFWMWILVFAKIMVCNSFANYVGIYWKNKKSFQKKFYVALFDLHSVMISSIFFLLGSLWKLKIPTILHNAWRSILFWLILVGQKEIRCHLIKWPGSDCWCLSSVSSQTLLTWGGVLNLDFELEGLKPSKSSQDDQI